MTQQKEKLNFFEIYSLLQEKLKYLGYKPRREEEKRGLPIHLFYVKDEKKKTEENLILQIFVMDESPEKKFFEEFFKRLQFYMFSLHPQIKVAIVVPEWMSDSIKEQIKKKCKNKNMTPKIGLWEINNNGEIEKRVNPESIREAMEEKIRDDYFNYKVKGQKVNIEPLRNIKDVKKMNEAIEKICEGTALIADGFIDNSVQALLLEPPHNQGETQICDVLMREIYEIRNLIYADELREVANEFFSINPEDYPFVKKWFKDLWGNEKILKVKAKYPDIGGEYEDLLKKLSPTYRDHFTHQFQVFLVGALIMDKVFEIYTPDKNKNKKDNWSRGWLLAATLHDFAYPVQDYDQWSNVFLRQILRFDEPLSSLELKRAYVENTLLSRIEHIIPSLNTSSYKGLKEKEKVDLCNRIRRFLYYEITERKNHCLMSSLALLKVFESKIEIFSNLVLPASIAIAIHDDDIWHILSGQRNETRFPETGRYIANLLNIKEKLTGEELSKQKPEFVEILKSKKFASQWLVDICSDIWDIFERPPLPHIKFEDQPLAFLLILCDNLQDWGRPFGDEELQKNLKAADPKFKGVTVDSRLKQIQIQLYTNFSPQARKFLDRKMEDLKVMQKVLKSKIAFTIGFWNREKNEELKDYSVEIGDL